MTREEFTKLPKEEQTAIIEQLKAIDESIAILSTRFPYMYDISLNDKIRDLNNITKDLDKENEVTLKNVKVDNLPDEQLLVHHLYQLNNAMGILSNKLHFETEQKMTELKNITNELVDTMVAYDITDDVRNKNIKEAFDVIFASDELRFDIREYMSPCLLDVFIGYLVNKEDIEITSNHVDNIMKVAYKIGEANTTLYSVEECVELIDQKLKEVMCEKKGEFNNDKDSFDYR